MGGGFPLRTMGSEPQAGLPSLQHQSQKGPQITPSCGKQQGFYLPGRNGWRHRKPYKRVNAQTFICSHLPCASAERGQNGQETLEESLGLVPLVRKLKEQLWGASASEVLPDTVDENRVVPDTILLSRWESGWRFPLVENALSPSSTWLLLGLGSAGGYSTGA